MADIFNKQQRSALMSRIRSHGNAATELRFIRLLKSSGITGWRRHYRLIGKPDFVFPKFRLAVFVDGCFWHGCPRCYSEPKSNRAFWRRKISANRDRAVAVKRELRKSGWRVFRIWQHELKAKNQPRLFRRLEGSLR
ncbi:MAG TPA: very short patch repair endonuclease [Verrucomicrobiae bacterium]|nr:very short patch repair endonuclease [Verrucomicrobiae bacterium]